MSEKLAYVAPVGLTEVPRLGRRAIGRIKYSLYVRHGTQVGVSAVTYSVGTGSYPDIYKSLCLEPCLTLLNSCPSSDRNRIRESSDENNPQYGSRIKRSHR